MNYELQRALVILIEALTKTVKGYNRYKDYHG